jgi:hypothetical protein
VTAPIGFMLHSMRGSADDHVPSPKFANECAAK